MLNEQPHQPLGVEDELVPAGLLVPVGLGFSKRRPARPARPAEASPDDGVHAPHLRRALEDTQRPRQRVALVRRGQRGPGDTDGLSASPTAILPLQTLG